MGALYCEVGGASFLERKFKMVFLHVFLCNHVTIIGWRWIYAGDENKGDENKGDENKKRKFYKELPLKEVSSGVEPLYTVLQTVT